MGSPLAALLRPGRASQSGVRSPSAGDMGAGVPLPAGMTQQQLAQLQQRRSWLLLQRLLLAALVQAPPEEAQQAAALASQLLPLLLADEAAPEGPTDTAAAWLQLLLAAALQAHSSIASAGQAHAQEALLPLQLQQRLAACEVAARAVVDAAPAAFGLQPPAQQADAPPQPQRRPQSLPELASLLQPGRVCTAAAQQVLLMRHAAQLHEGSLTAVHEQVQAASQVERRQAAAAQEDGAQCLGALLAADRLRRAAGRQAADEAAQLRQRAWRDLQRALTSGRGLWAEEERPEGGSAGLQAVDCCTSRGSAARLACAVVGTASAPICPPCTACPAELHWKLDWQEDASRRRLRLKRNFRFEQ